MVQQFVDHFKVKEFGFNFFPALGFVIGIFLGQVVMFLYFFQSNLIRKVDFNYVPYSGVIYFAVLLSAFLILCLHVAKTDVGFLVIFSLGEIVIGVLTRLIPWLTFNYPPAFYQEGNFVKTVFGVRSLVGSLIFGAATALALIILYNVVKRLDFALVFGFPAGALVSQLYYLIFNLATGGKLEFLDLEFIALDMLEAALCGFLFYVGYSLFMRAKGWRAAKGEFFQTGEETAPRANLLSPKFTFSVLLTSALFDVVFLAVVLSKLNLNRNDYYQPGSFPPALTGWVDVVFMPVLIVAALSSLLIAVVFLLFIYRSWTALQDARSKTSPLSAALLLFVPVFNLYWMIHVFYGFAKEYNSLADRHRLNVPKLPTWLYLTSGILGVVNVIALIVFSLLLDSGNGRNYISLLNILLFPAVIQTVIVLAIIYLTCQAVNRIPPEVYGAGPAIRRPV